jgi:hypothetical protein
MRSSRLYRLTEGIVRRVRLWSDLKCPACFFLREGYYLNSLEQPWLYAVNGKGPQSAEPGQYSHSVVVCGECHKVLSIKRLTTQPVRWSRLVLTQSPATARHWLCHYLFQYRGADSRERIEGGTVLSDGLYLNLRATGFTPPSVTLHPVDDGRPAVHADLAPYCADNIQYSWLVKEFSDASAV